MADRLRELLDLVIASLDDSGTDGTALADRASFSRDHLDRLLAAATGESAVALRRRLLLERAAWLLREGAVTPSAAATTADFGSLAAFSRAFSRAYGVPPSAFAANGRSPRLEAPNGIHFHPPAGLLVPGTREPTARHDLTDRMVVHHLDRTRALLDAAAGLPDAALAEPRRPGFVAVWFDGEEPSAALMAERLVETLEVWVAAIAGEPVPERPGAERTAAETDGPVDAKRTVDAGWPAAPDASHLRDRFDRTARRFARLARGIRDRGAWDDAFVDALCEPPQSFTYGGVLAHVLSYGAIRREMLASVLVELGAELPDTADPIMWEQLRRW